MSNANGMNHVPTWVPAHQRQDNQDHIKNDSFRVNRGMVKSPEFQSYLKQCGDLDIVVEGDSWFDLWRPRPGYDCLMDVLKDLKDTGYFHHRFVSFAHYGDTLDNMAYGKIESGAYQYPGLDEVIVAAKQIKAKALLFSAGGNDIVGPEFKMLINHAKSGRAPQRKDVVDYIIHGYIKDTYLECGKRLWKELPDAKMFVHGYANSWPSGKGYTIPVVNITVAGPWLLPSLLEKAYPYADRRKIVIDLMAEFNKMLSTLPAINKNFVYVDFRNVVGENENNDWEDELHLSSPALKIAGKYLADAIIASIGN